MVEPYIVYLLRNPSPTVVDVAESVPTRSAMPPSHLRRIQEGRGPPWIMSTRLFSNFLCFSSLQVHPESLPRWVPTQYPRITRIFARVSLNRARMSFTTPLPPVKTSGRSLNFCPHLPGLPNMRPATPAQGPSSCTPPWTNYDLCLKCWTILFPRRPWPYPT